MQHRRTHSVALTLLALGSVVLGLLPNGFLIRSTLAQSGDDAPRVVILTPPANGAIAINIRGCPAGMRPASYTPSQCTPASDLLDFSLAPARSDRTASEFHTLADATHNGSTYTWSNLPFDTYNLQPEHFAPGYDVILIPNPTAQIYGGQSDQGIGSVADTGYRVTLSGEQPTVSLDVYVFRTAQTTDVVTPQVIGPVASAPVNAVATTAIIGPANPPSTEEALATAGPTNPTESPATTPGSGQPKVIYGNQSLPSQFIGQWQGTGTQTNPTLQWPITMTLTSGRWGDTVGTVNYPTLGCSSQLTLVAAGVSNGKLIASLTEHVTSGTCVDSGTFSLVNDLSDTMTFGWRSPDGASTAQGQLRRVEQSATAVPTAEPGGTTYVSVALLACSSTTTVTFGITPLPFSMDAGPDCSGPQAPVSLTITDSSGVATNYQETTGFTLELPPGTYTITENASGQSATFDAPPVDNRQQRPPQCEGYAGCMLIVVQLPQAAPTSAAPMSTEPGATLPISVMAYACPPDANVSFGIRVISPFPPAVGPPPSDCTWPAIDFTVTDSSGNVSSYETTGGGLQLSLAPGSYTISEVSTGASAAFDVPTQCDGTTACLLIVISVPTPQAMSAMNTSSATVPDIKALV